MKTPDKFIEYFYYKMFKVDKKHFRATSILHFYSVFTVNFEHI